MAQRFGSRLVRRTIPQLTVVLAVLRIPKLVQAWLLHFEEAHPWQWLRDVVIRPLLGGS